MSSGLYTAGTPLGSATPQPLGTAAAGTSTNAAREDHAHATIVSNATPQRLGVAAAGSSTSAARDDHVHPIALAAACLDHCFIGI